VTQRILSGALVAGLLTGILAAFLNIVTLRPLILEAETFEVAISGQDHLGRAQTETTDQEPVPPANAAEEQSAWGPHLGTIALTLVAYLGFGLILGTGMAVAARSGYGPTARRGAIWGAAAFLAFNLAPAAGLPPKLPGMDAADLTARQAWWIFCMASTALGLAAMAFGRGLAQVLLGLLLIALPHLVGAPIALESESLVPSGLAAEFATRSLGVAALIWIVLGTLTGALAQKSVT
jgi:cobalt transporter subunit CbtA